MNDNTINVEDLVLPELPEVSQDVGTQVPTPVINNNSELSLFMEKAIISFSLMTIFIIIFLILFLILKRKKQNTIQTTYNKKKKKPRKQKQNINIDIENRLETPENLKDCIRLFLERTK